MSQSPAYNRAYSFQSYQALNPTTPLPADQVDLEYNRIKATLDAVLANLALIQRDDGAIANGSIGADQLAAGLLAGIEPPTKWITSHSYIVDATVFQTNKLYRCLISHTSGTFSTDLAASKWLEIADFSTLTQNADLITYDHAASGLAASTVQAALDELASEKLDKAGGTMSGAIAMGGARITGLPTSAAASASDAMSRGAFDIRGDANYQPLDSDLTAIAALTTTSYGRSFLALANSAAFLALLPVASASDVLNALLTVDGTGSGVDADKVHAVTPGTFGLALLDDAAASNGRTTMGLGGLAVLEYTDLVYAGSSASNVAFPVGTTITVKIAGAFYDRNASATIKLGATTDEYQDDGAGATVTGTWRSRGVSGANHQTFQRTA